MMSLVYEMKDIQRLIDYVSVYVDQIRLIDAEECRAVSISENSRRIVGEQCFEQWKEYHRCSNCIGYQAVMTRRVCEKYEKYGNEIVHMTAIPVRVRGGQGEECTYALEVVTLHHIEEGRELIRRAEEMQSMPWTCRDRMTAALHVKIMEKQQFEDCAEDEESLFLKVRTSDCFQQEMRHSPCAKIMEAVFAHLLQTCIRRTDWIIHTGEGEFLLVLPFCDDVMAEQISHRVKHMLASFGISVEIFKKLQEQMSGRTNE